jgi:DNA polymerase-4
MADSPRPPELRARCVLHVDMDAFYASVEQRDDPALAGRPVLVGGRPPRGVVAAASYEARRYGVRSAMPMREALARCPDAVVVRPRMSHYQAVSRQVFDLLRRLTPDVEGLSLDEAYLDFTGSPDRSGDPEGTAACIKKAILEATGLTASVGAGPNKLVAKVASDLGKPDGLVVLFGEAVERTFAELPVRAIGGIGPKTGARLVAAGIRTLGELARAPSGAVAPIFGRYAPHVQKRARGIDDRPVRSRREAVSLGAEETFSRDLADAAALARELRPLADKVGARLRRKGYLAGQVSVKIRRADFHTVTRQRALVPPTAESAALFEAGWALVEDWIAAHPGVRIRLLGITAGKLTIAAQLALFENGGERLDRVADAIRERFGDASLLHGSDLPGSSDTDA